MESDQARYDEERYECVEWTTPTTMSGWILNAKATTTASWTSFDERQNKHPMRTSGSQAVRSTA